MLSAGVLAFMRESGTVIGASNQENQKSNQTAGQNDEKKTETIYQRRECKDGVCKDSGKKLLQIKGADAECEKMKDETARMKCYSENSQAAYACSFLETEQEVQKCFEKKRGNLFQDNQGGAGTLVANRAVTSNGSRMYLNGFDCRGEHSVMTGTDQASNQAMTFYEGSRDVRYGGDVSVGADIDLFAETGGVYFGSDVEYGNYNYGNGNYGMGIVDYDNFNGMNLNRCGDMKVLANHRHIMSITAGKRPAFGATEFEKGLDINGDLKTDFMYFQGRFLQWTEPIRGHFVLYYKTPPSAPDRCTLPDYPRDKQPKSTPSLEQSTAHPE